MRELSTFLFAEPSFGGGMARVLDLGGVLNVYNVSQSGKQADFWALYADWRAVGDEIRSSAKTECARFAQEKKRDVQRGAGPTRNS